MFFKKKRNDERRKSGRKKRIFLYTINVYTIGFPFLQFSKLCLTNKAKV